MPDPTPAWVLPAGAGLLVLLGTIMGAAQWLALAGRVPRAGEWIAWSALAWALGLLPPFLAGGLMTAESAPALAIGVMVASGLAMGVIVGAVTGLGIVRFENASPAHFLRENRAPAA